MNALFEFVIDRYINKSLDAARRRAARAVLIRLDRSETHRALLHLRLFIALAFGVLLVVKFFPRSVWPAVVLAVVASTLLLQIRARSAVRWLATQLA